MLEAELNSTLAPGIRYKPGVLGLCQEKFPRSIYSQKTAPKMHWISPHQAILQNQLDAPQFSSDTTYLEIAADPTG